MNLVRKLEIAKQSIASITQHDDATQDEIVESGRILAQYLKDELAAAAARREQKKAERLAKLQPRE